MPNIRALSTPALRDLLAEGQPPDIAKAIERELAQRKLAAMGCAF